MITPFYIKTERFLNTFMKKLEHASVGMEIVHILIRHVFNCVKAAKKRWREIVSFYSMWYKSVVNLDAFLYFHV